MRLGAVFIALCMVLIAGSAGAAAFLVLGFSPSAAVTVALAVLATLVVFNTVSGWLGTRAVVGRQLADLSHGVAELARQVAEISRRLAALDGRVGTTLDKTRAVTDPLSVEMAELGTIVKQLADSVAAHDTTLAELGRSASAEAPAAAASPLAPSPAPPPSAHEPAAAAATDAAAAADLPEVQSPEAAVAWIRSAIDAGRIDLYLQPIVTLPQRKVRYYEAMSRLRTEQGEVVAAAEFIRPAESGGLMPKIDNLVVFRCVQVVRRLLLKNREVGLFCNISGATLADGAVFEHLLEFLEANRAIAPSLLLEFTQDFLRNTGPIENESLSALHERGYRFSVDNVHDLRFEPRDLAQRGVRFVKVPANLLLDRNGSAATDIHAADLSGLLSRFGIDLVAEKIESEGVVVDLLDYDVRLGQGFLFSPPRPVRAEALQGLSERDVVAREAPDGAAAEASARAADPGSDAANGKRSGLAQLARRI